uniref:ATP-dependent dethiobiotin synthetase BioD n=1 Tax=uncultured verrucomicrobium HF0500_16O23 TaxID=723598 RepID=E7C584_9BACT|nr:dethiobiotin synthetase [uncultured verrucomicrobium HF0500_16O23]
MTGTDTGAGKTVLTALLLAHLRSQGVNALAMKPVCAGPRSDVRLLQSLQRGGLSDEEMNPFWYQTPVAPIVAAKDSLRKPTLARLNKSIQGLRERCDMLLVEGAGGLMVPLAKKLTWEGLIKSLKCPVLVAAKNQLGVINHGLLTINRLQTIGVKRFGFCLIDHGRISKRGSAESENLWILNEFSGKCPVFIIPYLGKSGNKPRIIEAGQKKTKKSLAQILKIV